MIPTKDQMDSLVQAGLATVKKQGDLSLYKYHRKVFYDNLWNTNSALLECRGHVFADNGSIVQLPFTKLFNLRENNKDLILDQMYISVRKMNGFMAAATLHNGEVLVTTTGSFDSGYVKLAKKWLGDIIIDEGYTYLFEICDSDNDPHIVKEDDGAYLIGIRSHKTGDMLNVVEYLQEDVAVNIGKIFVPEIVVLTGQQLRDMQKTDKHEGWVVYELDGVTPVLKIKSHHYLSKKAMMRMGKGKVLSFYNNPQKFKERVDEELYPIIDYVIANIDKSVWQAYNDQQRRQVIEEML